MKGKSVNGYAKRDGANVEAVMTEAMGAGPADPDQRDRTDEEMIDQLTSVNQQLKQELARVNQLLASAQRLIGIHAMELDAARSAIIQLQSRAG